MKIQHGEFEIILCSCKFGSESYYLFPDIRYKTDLNTFGCICHLETKAIDSLNIVAKL